MRAVAVRKTNDVPELIDDLPVPRPAPGELLVRLEAASLNPLDVGIAAGYFEGRMPHVYPLVLGTDGAGRVVEVGEGVRGFAPGDFVHGQLFRTPLGHGTFAEYVVVTESPDNGALQRVPNGVTAETAAAIPTAGMTAIGALDAIGLRSGQSILIVGATGGVGVFVVQLAAMYGAEVIATARPDADAWIRRLGATQTVDYSADSLAEQVRKTYPDGVDAVIDLTRDPVGFAEIAGLVRDGGTAMSVAVVATPELLASERITVINYMMQNKPDLLVRITAEVASGRIMVPIEQTITLDQVPAALASTGGARGKTTVRIVPAETTAERRQRGERIAAERSGEPNPALLQKLDREFPFLANALTAYAVGDVLARNVLDVRTQELALVAAFAALGLGDFIKLHGGYALNAGVSEDELKEIVYLTTIPAGFPRAIQASQAIAELIEARNHA